MSVSVTLYLAFLGALALERLRELQLSRRHAAAALAQGAVEHGQAHLRVMVALHAAFLVACPAEVLLLHRRDA